MLKTLEKIHDIFSKVIVVVLVSLTVMLVGVRIFGLHVFTVLSGSMEPVYPTGSLIYVKAVDPDELATGDVITYLIRDNTVVTHRIAGVVPDENDPSILRFRTKGDANNTEDMMLVHENNIIGSPVFCIPYIGYVANFIQNPPGTYITVAVASLLLMIMFIPDLFVREEEPEEDTPAQDEASADTPPETTADTESPAE